MKAILALTIIMLAMNQVFSCTGYLSADKKTCLQATSINGCKVYAAPISNPDGTSHLIKCQTCYSQLDLSTDALSCTPKSASYALNLLNDGSTDKFIDVYMHLLYNDDTVDYTMVSCVIASQIVPYCQDGYYLKDDFKCTACTDSTNCLECDLTDPAKCLLCDDEFYLSATNTCLACGTGALKCTDDKIAKECKPKFFLKTDDNTCSPCGSNALTCTDLTHAKSCETGYFKSTDTCTQCASLVSSCTSLTAITACAVSSDSTKYNYLNGEACIAHLKSNNCLTITGAAGAEKCDSCISGYKLDNGVCYHWSHWINGSYSADNAAVANITEGTSSTAATFTCQADYWWKDTAVCKACIAGCKTCTTSILTGCTVADDVVKTHYNDTASSVLACATVGTYTGSTPAAAPLVKTCTVAAGVRTTLTCVTDDSAATKLLYTSTGAYTSAYTVSCVAIAATVDTIVSGCLEYKEDSAAAQECQKCISTTPAMKLSYATTAFTGAITKTCAATSTTATDAHYACLKYQYYSTPATNCTQCISTHYLDTTTANAARCVIKTNCTQMSQTENKCTACTPTTYVLLSTGVCAAAIANCKTINTTTTTKCDECNAGYYFGQTAQTSCIDTLTSCKVKSPTMTKVKDCFACNIGYKWNATNLACEVCGETNVCVKTGCESLAPAGNGSTTPAAANSALIVFIFTTFVALITLLI